MESLSAVLPEGLFYNLDGILHLYIFLIKYMLTYNKKYDNNILKEIFLISDAIDMILSNQAVAYQSWIVIQQ